MKILYIDCSMGAAGDMLSSALYELLDDKEEFINKINSLGIPGAAVSAEKSVKCGVAGTHINVDIHGVSEAASLNSADCETDGRSMKEIENIIGSLNLIESIKTDIISVYKDIAAAESTVHGVPVTDIHFHEIGTIDAVADIASFCMLVGMLGVDKIVASPVNVGSGKVCCAHGILPVPAPAAANLLKGVPIYSSGIKGELCTPTGAALLKHFVSSFGDIPLMTVEKTGYGMGCKDFEEANCVRAIIGESVNEQYNDTVCVLSCNLDDMTSESVSFACERLFDEGALDVYTTPIVMKKGRLAVKLSVTCALKDREKMIHSVFKHTSTLGIRESINKRYVLERYFETEATSMGDIRVKKSKGYGIQKEKYEYDDIAKAASENGLSLSDVIKLIEKSKD